MTLGFPSVRELLSRVTSSEVTELLAYHNLDPRDGSRGDLQAALVCSTVANVNRGKNSSPIKPDMFMPDFYGKRDSVGAEDVFARLQAASAMTRKAEPDSPEPVVKVITPGRENKDGV
jgi:hypothetical protein